MRTAVISLLLMLLPVPARVAPAPANPTGWHCDAKSLSGLGTDTVQLAPLLTGGGASSQALYGRPDARGRWVPVVMVHGWVGQDTHDARRDGAFSHLVDMIPTAGQQVSTTRSLIDSLQHLAGVAVFTFDYRDYAARWVDDGHLGPALAEVIDCLYKASGEKVIVIAHSMGGLVTRYAATHAATPGEIGRVITFGTPEKGSVAAAIVNGVLTATSLASDAVALFHLFLAYCGALASGELRTGTVCDGLKPPVRAFLSAAGIALEYGSPQLAALDAWPSGIVVNALAGDAEFTTSASWFGFGATTSTIGLGDMVVTAGSAADHATTSTKATCHYQLVATQAVAQRLELSAHLIGPQDVAAQPLGAFTGACFHTSLMRDIDLTNSAIHRVQDDLAARLKAAGQQYVVTDLPGLCGTVTAPGKPPAEVTAPYSGVTCAAALGIARQYYRQPSADLAVGDWTCTADDNAAGDPGPDPRIGDCYNSSGAAYLDRPFDRSRTTPDCSASSLATALRADMKPANSFIVAHRCAYGYAVVLADNGIDGFAAALVYRNGAWRYVDAGTDQSEIALRNELSRPVINGLLTIVGAASRTERVRI